MTNFKDLKKGTSTCLFGTPTEDNIQKYKDTGVNVLEVGASSAEQLRGNEILSKGIYKNYSLSLWSTHLPFSGKLDISKTDDEARRFIIDLNKEIIEAASELGFNVAVLHPSSEPITDEDRPERLRRSRDAIIELNEVANAHGIRLAVENLPRTCLCNRSSEMIDLLKGTGAGVVFDTNHSLVEDNCEFLKALINAGLEIVTLHISDYDMIDERHVLPGEGVNNWKQLISILEEADYKGPVLYEVPAKPRSKETPYTPEDIKINQQKLISGKF